MFKVGDRVRIEKSLSVYGRTSNRIAHLINSYGVIDYISRYEYDVYLNNGHPLLCLRIKTDIVDSDLITRWVRPTEIVHAYKIAEWEV